MISNFFHGKNRHLETETTPNTYVRGHHRANTGDDSSYAKYSNS